MFADLSNSFADPNDSKWAAKGVMLVCVAAEAME